MVCIADSHSVRHFRCQSCQISLFQRVAAQQVDIRYLIGMQGLLIDSFQIFTVRSKYGNHTDSTVLFSEGYCCRIDITGQCLIGIPAIDCLLSSKQLQSASALLCLTHLLRTSVNSCSSHGDHSCCSNHSFFQKHNYLKPLIRYRCPK